MENRKRDEEVERGREGGAGREEGGWGEGEGKRKMGGGRGKKEDGWGGGGGGLREERRGGREEEKIISPLEWYDSCFHHPLASTAHRSVEQCC